MTQKNGTVEFKRNEKQAAFVHNPYTGRLMRFNKESDKYFTADPTEIKILDKLGYERGAVKLDGVKVDVESLSADDIERVMKALAKRAERLGVSTPNIKEPEADVVEAVVEDVKEFKDDVELDNKEEVVEIPEVKEEKVEAKGKKRLSSKLMSEIEE